MTEASYILEKLNEMIASTPKSDFCGCSVSVDYRFKKIQIIDDMKIVVTLRTYLYTKEKQWNMRYMITPEFNCYFDFHRYELHNSSVFKGIKGDDLNINLVEELLNDLRKNLKVMKLDVFGKLATDICLENFDEYLDGDECCVCHDITTTKTNCNHNLCIKCWGKIIKDKCPLCRKKHPKVKGYEEEEEESDSDNE